MHVDGFRVDLATILAAMRIGFDERPAFWFACRRILCSARSSDSRAHGIAVRRLSGGGFPPLDGVEWTAFATQCDSYWMGKEGQLGERARPPYASGDFFQSAWPSALRFNQPDHRHDGFTCV